MTQKIARRCVHCGLIFILDARNACTYCGEAVSETDPPIPSRQRLPAQAPLEIDAATKPEDESPLVGSTCVERYLAAVFDNLCGLLLVITVAITISERLSLPKRGYINALIGFAVFSLYFAYFAVCEGMLSTTPGKAMFGMRVQKLDGSNCGWRAAIIRTLTRLLEVNPFILGCIPAAIIVRWSKRKQRWGDQLAGTLVVEKRGQS